MADEESEVSWDTIQSDGPKIIASSLTSLRIPALKKLQHVLSNNPPKEDKITLQTLAVAVLKTYNYYQDSVSRAQALLVLEAYIEYDRNYLDVFVKYICQIAAKSANLALPDVLTLMSWANRFSILCLSLADTDKVFRQIIEVQVLLLYACAEGSTIEGHKHKLLHRKRAFDACLCQTKQTIVDILIKSTENGSAMIDTYILAAVGVKGPASAVLLFLAVLSDAVCSLQPVEPSFFDFLAKSSKQVIDFFINQVVLAKVPPAHHAIVEFTKYYIASFVNNEEFILTVLPAVEKAILRSSEIGFCHIALPLFSTGGNIDISSEFSRSKLLTHILNGIKSSKENVREGAYDTLKAILTLSVPHILEDNTAKVTDEILKTFKGTSNADSKILLAKGVHYIPLSETGASKILTAVVPLASKELNESILSALVEVLTSGYVHALRENWTISDKDKIESQFKTGLENAKPALRRIWACQLGEALYKKPDGTEDFVSKIFPALIKSLEEATKSPLLTVTNKGISCAYVCIVLAKAFQKSLDLDAQKVLQDPLTHSGDKFSILVSAPVFSKLVGNDQKWCLRSLIACFEYADNPSFATAYSYFAISANVSYSVRLEALDSIKKLVERASNVFIDGILSVIHTEGSDADLNYNMKHLAPVLNILTQVSDKALAEHNLVRLITVAHHDAIALKEKWIGLALRAHVDPHKILDDNVGEIFSIITHELEVTESSSNSYQAACQAMATIAFVNPEVVSPYLADLLKKELDINKLKDIDANAVAMWNAPEGQVVVDVLNSKPKKAEDKNSKDYETRKWEENLKKEIAHKNKGAKKLTKEEQALVAEQLVKESAIRKEVDATVKQFFRAFNIIRELTAGPLRTLQQVETTWFLVMVEYVVLALKVPVSGELFGDYGAATFIQASNVLTSRLGSLKDITGVAVLKVNNVEVPANYEQIPMLSLLSRVLFRVKILADDFFDDTSFIYILPLLTRVLEIGKDVAIKNLKKQVVTSEFSDEDPEEEHLLLAIGIILSQAMLQNDAIPRKLILELLISLMKISSKAKMAKECFLTVCQQISVSLLPQDVELLLANLVIPDTFVKGAILQGIDSEFDLDNMSYADEIWITMHDNDDQVAEVAQTIWEENNFSLVPDAPLRLLKFVSDEDAGMRLTVARSIVHAVATLEQNDPSIFDDTLNKLIELYYEKEVPPPPQLDRFGLAINAHLPPKDEWEARSTIALTLKELSPLFRDEASITKVFQFLVEKETLGDKEEHVAQELLDAGVEIVKLHGLSYVEQLIPIFETCLGQIDTGSKKQDRIRELVIILYGSLGRHLDASDERLASIVDRLLKTLDTPSEDVQYAVSECIAPLVSSIEPTLQQHLDDLFEKLWNGKNLAVRKGAAYGIAGLVKGAGIRSLYANDVMRTISDAADDKKNEKMREGVSFVLDCLSQSLGAMFEPYVIEVLPTILRLLGDPSPLVREATDMAARQIMKSTTSYGVKRLIPLAVSNLDDIQWRSKKGAVELLGSMAYLDPTQLSASLATIVPEIVRVLNDSHKEVRKAAEQALQRFGDVIRNPEIHAIVPVLVRAIGDPATYTDTALDTLIATQFVHYIDGASLALIVHVIHRGMRDRLALTKKKACQIVGNMAILVARADLLPYLSTLVTELELAMVDPVPATRSTGARALGSLVEKLGEEQFPDLIPRLVATLHDATKAGDRLGSAQALAEVISGLGLAKLDEMLPSILEAAQSRYAHVRAGFMPLLLFLPVCFGSQFAPYLASIVPPILAGLADEDEDIRDTALRAGRLLVTNYASRAVDLLLPELEAGMADISPRIRLSSLELTGDLLFQVTGISGKNELVEGQEVGRSLAEALGPERRDRVLSALFVCRCDVAPTVRLAAVDIWKALVANTPRTVKEIVPELTHTIVRRLASGDDTDRAIAAATLGEVVRRVGANALAQVLPALESLFVSADADARQGICIATAELAAAAGDDAVQQHHQVFVGIVQDALVDGSPDVRKAAAAAFDALHARSPAVVAEIVPRLLRLVETGLDLALWALQDLVARKPDVMVPAVVPELAKPRLDAVRARALAAVVCLAGPAAYSRIGPIITTMVKTIVEMEEREKKEASKEDNSKQLDSVSVCQSLDQILASVDDDAGVIPLMLQVMSLAKNEDASIRAAMCARMAPFFAASTLDISMYVPDLALQLVLALGDRDNDVVVGAVSALTALVKAQDKPMLERLVRPAQQALSLAGVPGIDLPGFCVPKGPASVLPIFTHGLMYGTGEQRELSALALGDIVDRTPASSLRTNATAIAGPLIRVVGERVSSDVKAAVVQALTLLLRKIPQFVRPFLPQLQRTFVRLLGDANETLRRGAVDAIAVLVEFQPRVDLLVTELVTLAKTSDNAVRNTMVQAMLQVITKGGANMSAASKAAVVAFIESQIDTDLDSKAAVVYARLMGALAQVLTPEEATGMLRLKLTADSFSILVVNSFLREAPGHVFDTGLVDDVANFVMESCASPVPNISDNATVAAGKLLLLQGQTCSPKQSVDKKSETPFEIPDELVAGLMHLLAVSAINPPSSSADTRRLALVVLRTTARFHYNLVKPHWDVVVPAVFTCLRDGIIPIRLAAEKAYLAVLNLVEDKEMADFTAWFDNASKGTITTVLGATIQPRSIGDYTKRVASRLAGVERERLEAGGDRETMFSDQIEDETEVWAVGV